VKLVAYYTPFAFIVLISHRQKRFIST